nr:MAG TPA: hypothetical protein [Caudoviricetes sp.]DAK39088.1 MAG TPA: hypothetical protein [Caudoviricetes sp.]DAS84771.1 MAG TPA: hypothetical protein [Caudoviricetes sp.]
MVRTLWQPLRAAGMSSLHIAQIHRPWAQCPGRFLIPQPVAPSRNGVGAFVYPEWEESP